MTYFSSKQPGIFNDPFAALDLLFKNELKSTSFFQPFNGHAKFEYPIDVYFDDAFLTFEIPILDGKKEDIKVTKTADSLRIKYTRSNADVKGDVTWVKRGIIKRDFDFSWRITSKFDSEKIQSSFAEGLLTVRIPFAAEQQPQEIEITTDAGDAK